MLQLRMRRFNVPAYAYSHGAYSVADSIPDAGPCTTSDADANLVAGPHAHLVIGTNNWSCLVASIGLNRWCRHQQRRIASRCPLCAARFQVPIRVTVDWLWHLSLGTVPTFSRYGSAESADESAAPTGRCSSAHTTILV